MSLIGGGEFFTIMRRKPEHQTTSLGVEGILVGTASERDEALSFAAGYSLQHGHPFELLEVSQWTSDGFLSCTASAREWQAWP